MQHRPLILSTLAICATLIACTYWLIDTLQAIDHDVIDVSLEVAKLQH
jgi:hypothetical protein